jgi:hypothetical protein
LSSFIKKLLTYQQNFMAKKLSLGRSIAEKHQELNQETQENTNNEIIKTTDEKVINSEITKIVSNRVEAKKTYDLTEIIIPGKYVLETKKSFQLETVAKLLGKSKEELATLYVEEALEKDLKKYKKELAAKYGLIIE